MLSMVKKKERIDIIELLNQCTMCTWGCAVSSSISSPNTPLPTLHFFFQYTIHFSFIRPTIFTLGMTLRMSLLGKQSVNRTALLSTFTLPLWKELCLFCTFSCPFLPMDWSTCIRVKKWGMNRWKCDSILWDTEVKGRNKFGRWHIVECHTYGHTLFRHMVHLHLEKQISYLV